MAKVEQENEKRAAGATTKDQLDAHGKIVEFLWWMKKQGYKETTVKGKWRRLSRLVKLGANLLNPESVKDVIALQGWKDSTKETTVTIYDTFVRALIYTQLINCDDQDEYICKVAKTVEQAAGLIEAGFECARSVFFMFLWPSSCIT